MMISGLYAILDLPHRGGLDPISVVEAMLAGGAAVVQLRSKRAALDPLLVAALGERCASANVPMIINDELELAEQQIPGVAGVHLGQTDLVRLGDDLHARKLRREQLRERGLALGVSTHDLRQLQAALAELQPDYVGFGPVFSTQSKTDHDPIVGLDALAQICALSSAPVVAIGGIDLERIAAVRSAGAAAVAVISALAGSSIDIVRARTCALANEARKVL